MHIRLCRFLYIGVLPESAKSQEHLKSLVKMLSEKNLLKSLKNCLGSGQDCAKVTDSVVCLMLNIFACLLYVTMSE